LHFAPDAEETLAFLVAFVNTAPAASRSGQDELPDVPVLMEFLDRFHYSGRRDRDPDELADVRNTRGRLRRVFDLDRDAAVEEVNAMLREARALPFLTRHDDFDWHLHATDPEAPLAERMRVEVSLALMDVIRSDEWTRLRICEAPDCDGVLLDLSRNAAKRYCSVRCGNRMNMIAYRRRQG
jgi:predicted RNA-binding Zn ribbon-like protein